MVAAAAAGVIAAAALGLGDDSPPPPQTAAETPAPTPSPGPSGMRTVNEIRVGRRPNVVRVAGDNVFVGSFRNDRLNLVSTKTGKVRSYAPRVGVGVNDAAVSRQLDLARGLP